MIAGPVDEMAERLAEHVLPALATRLESEADAGEPYLAAEDAAAYIAAPKARIYELVKAGEIEHRRDGRRILTKRRWLDEYLEEVAA